MTPLFHLVTPADLERHSAAGLYAPPSLSSEGFIHLSHLEQVEATRERFYRDVAPLLLLEIAPRGLPVREDETSEGRLPHLYGPLPRQAIARAHPMPASGLPQDLAFGSNVCAPPFEFEQLRMGARDELLASFPQHAELIRPLSHGPADTARCRRRVPA